MVYTKPKQTTTFVMTYITTKNQCHYISTMVSCNITESKQVCFLVISVMILLLTKTFHSIRPKTVTTSNIMLSFHKYILVIFASEFWFVTV
jgi:hypothetical protein